MKKNEWDKNFKFSKRNPYVSNDEDLDLLTDKGVYPYDYFTSFDKFRERQLPPKDKFYSNLTESNIEDDEYERALKIWEHFGIRNLGQYHDLYLRTDVLLLTDVFENFRDLCLEYYCEVRNASTTHMDLPQGLLAHSFPRHSNPCKLRTATCWYMPSESKVQAGHHHDFTTTV